MSMTNCRNRRQRTAMVADWTQRTRDAQNTTYSLDIRLPDTKLS